MFIRFCKASVTVVPRHFRQVVQKAAGEEGARRTTVTSRTTISDSTSATATEKLTRMPQASNGFNHMHLSMQRLLVSKG